MRECVTHHHACDCREAEFAKLRAFAQDVMRSWPGGDVDGADLQDYALRSGLIEPAEPTVGERVAYALEEGDAWYRKTALLTPNT